MPEFRDWDDLNSAWLRGTESSFYFLRCSYVRYTIHILFSHSRIPSFHEFLCFSEYTRNICYPIQHRIFSKGHLPPFHVLANSADTIPGQGWKLATFSARANHRGVSLDLENPDETDRQIVRQTFGGHEDEKTRQGPVYLSADNHRSRGWRHFRWPRRFRCLGNSDSNKIPTARALAFYRLSPFVHVLPANGMKEYPSLRKVSGQNRKVNRSLTTSQ